MYLEKVDCLNDVVEQVKINDEYYIVGNYGVTFKLIKGNYQSGWTELKILSELHEYLERRYAKMLVDGNSIYLFTYGGWGEAYIYIDKYNIITNEWTFVNKISVDRGGYFLNSVFNYKDEKYIFQKNSSNKYIYKSKDFTSLTEIFNTVKDTSTTEFRFLTSPYLFNNRIYFLGKEVSGVTKVTSFDGKNLKDEFNFPNEILEGYKKFFRLLNAENADGKFICGRCINPDDKNKNEPVIGLYKIFKLKETGFDFIKDVYISCGKNTDLKAPFEYDKDGSIKSFLGEISKLSDRITISKAYVRRE